MERIPVKSSAIAAMAYDAPTQTLEVEFPGKNGVAGPVWQYSPVPMEVYGAMTITGASIGSIFAREIKSSRDMSAIRVQEEAVANT